MCICRRGKYIVVFIFVNMFFSFFMILKYLLMIFSFFVVWGVFFVILMMVLNFFIVFILSMFIGRICLVIIMNFLSFLLKLVFVFWRIWMLLLNWFWKFLSFWRSFMLCFKKYLKKKRKNCEILIYVLKINWNIFFCFNDKVFFECIIGY